MIALRYKKMASGKYSIYLDRYNEATRKRSYCFLKLHVTKNYSGNKKVAPQDEKTMLAAMVELQKASFEFNDSCKTGEKSVSTEDGAITLISFLEKQCFQPSSNNMALLKQTKDFLKGKDIVLDRINTKWLDKFKSYMSERLSDTTVSTRLMLFRTHLNRALKQGLLKRNLFESYPLKKGTPKNRQFLTDKELNQLIHTPTTFNPQIRGAFLFACYSGLRWDDVENLKQLQVSEGIEKADKRFIIGLKHIKSAKTYQVELSKEAWDIIEKYVKNKQELVFDKLPNKPNCNIKLHLWGAMAGIDTDLCFSVARNTYTVNLLKKGHPLKEARKRIGLVNTHSARIYETMLQKGNSTP